MDQRLRFTSHCKKKSVYAAGLPTSRFLSRLVQAFVYDVIEPFIKNIGYPRTEQAISTSSIMKSHDDDDENDEVTKKQSDENTTETKHNGKKKRTQREQSFKTEI